jgi:glycerophosphoryl diester phosphodiesterase
MNRLFGQAKRPLVFGHRGYSELAPENTMKAFDLCVERGVPGIELDIHVCRSGELVVIHDHDLKRLAGIHGIVEDLDYRQLSELDVGSHKGAEFAGEHIPLLDELFDRYGDRFYYDIELKVKGWKDTKIGEKTWETIGRHGLENVCMVSSFNPFALRYFNRSSKGALPTAVIYCESKDVPKLLQHGWGRHIAQATVLKPDQNQVDASMLRKFREHKGYPVLTWTVNDKSVGDRLIGLGVDGIISNDPGLFL